MPPCRVLVITQADVPALGHGQAIPLHQVAHHDWGGAHVWRWKNFNKLKKISLKKIPYFHLKMALGFFAARQFAVKKTQT